MVARDDHRYAHEIAARRAAGGAVVGAVQLAPAAPRVAQMIFEALVWHAPSSLDRRVRAARSHAACQALRPRIGSAYRELLTDDRWKGERDVDETGSDERRARRAALAAKHRRRRMTAVGVFVAIVVVLVFSLSRSGSGGPPPATDAKAAAIKKTKTATTPAARRAARQALDDASIDDVLAYTSYVAAGSKRRKEVALTFDDGPGPTTPALLHYLTTNHVPATFFLVGRSIAQHTDTVRAQGRDGFSLGTHTENHARLGARTVADQSQEILTAADRITQITGHAVKLFRPPYGSFDSNTLTILHQERMVMVLWSVDTKDYAQHSPAPIVYTALSGARAGSVVLMHDGPIARPNTLAAVRKIVPALRRKGYRLVSIPELLRDDPPPHHQSAPHSLAGG